MNDLMTFRNDQFGEIRSIMIDEQPWFVGKDIAISLGYSNHRDALMKHVSEEDKKDGVAIRDSIGRSQRPVLINESGLYSLIFSSQLPAAKEFKHWVTSEVLPAIRRDGGYMLAAQSDSDSAIMARALLIAQKTLERQEKLFHATQRELEEERPLADFARAVTASPDTMLVREFCKILKKEGIDMGGTRMFAWLRDNGYLIASKTSDYNSPTQKAMDLGLFETKMHVVQSSTGYTKVTCTPRITGKGQVYFLKKLKEEQAKRKRREERD